MPLSEVHYFMIGAISFRFNLEGHIFFVVCPKSLNSIADNFKELLVGQHTSVLLFSGITVAK